MTSYTQVTKGNWNTVDGSEWCARWLFNAFGGKNGWGFGTATAAWNGQVKRHPGELPPAGVDVPIWFSVSYDPRGHAAMSCSDGKIRMVTMVPNSHGQSVYASLSDFLQRFPAFKYLGWGEQMDGTVVVRPASLAANQRKVGPVPAIRRAQPTRQSPAIHDQLDANSIGNFKGWILGENIEGNAIWFQGDPSGNWFWSGSFTSQSTDGLTDLNPKTPAPTTGKRQVKADSSVNVRTFPTTQSPVVTSIAAGAIIAPAGYTNGEDIYDSDIWYKVEGGWAWGGAFTETSAAGLTFITRPDETKPPAPEPTLPDYEAFEAFSDCVTQVLPAHRENFEIGRFSPDQYEVVLHDFGTDGKDTFTSTTNWFRNKASGTSAHFVVSGKNIVQMVSLQNRAWHAGPEGNNRVGIEIDPALGRVGLDDQLRKDTMESVITLLIELDKYYQRELGLRKHPEFMATGCGDDVDLQLFVNRNAVTPDPTPVPDLEAQLILLLEQNRDLLQTIYRVEVK